METQSTWVKWKFSVGNPFSDVLLKFNMSTKTKYFYRDNEFQFFHFQSLHNFIHVGKIEVTALEVITQMFKPSIQGWSFQRRSEKENLE